MANDTNASPPTIAAGDRVMLNDGNWDTVTDVVSAPDADGASVVNAAKAKRSATVKFNENGVWQELWAV